MNAQPNDPLERRRLLSALADGDADAAAAGCAAWAGDADARATWHAYHLIGDVLRSEDLARRPVDDLRVLAGVRERLAREPVVLAPPAARPRRRLRWLAPAAAAAGFAAVAGMVIVTRVASPVGEGASELAAARPPVDGVRPVTAGTAVAPAVVAPQDLRMIRDARLDRYLQAHREGLGAAPAAVPGGALRSVETIVPQR